MANKTINDLTLLAAPAGTELIELDDGASKKATVASLGATLGVPVFTQPAGSPVSLANNATVDVTHPAVTNEKLMISAWINTALAGQTNVAIDFDLADEADYTQESASAGTDFLAGSVKLHDSGTQSSTDLMPAFSGPTNGGLTVSESHGDSNVYLGWKLFDNVNTPGGLGVWLSDESNPGDANPAWVKVDLGSGNEKVIWRYKMTANLTSSGLGNGGPTSWRFQGSNDNSAWTTIETITGQTWTSWETKTFDAAAYTTPYRYYRFFFLGQTGGSYGVAAAEIELMEVTTVYPTSTWYYVHTNTNAFASASLAAVINSVTITATTPASTSLTGLVSFDGRTTWKKWNGSAWATHTGGLSNISTGNTIAEVQTGLAGHVPGVGETIDFAFGLYTTVASSSPSIDGISINYDQPTSYDMATVGAYGASTDFGVRRLTSTTTRIKNQSGSTKSAFINIVTR